MTCKHCQGPLSERGRLVEFVWLRCSDCGFDVLTVEMER
jgi:hypothetical protein